MAEPRSTCLPAGRFRLPIIIRDYFGKRPKIEFSLFHPSVSHSTDISPEIQGRIYGTPRQSLEEFFD
jgi:hypothetical protein